MTVKLIRFTMLSSLPICLLAGFGAAVFPARAANHYGVGDFRYSGLQDNGPAQEPAGKKRKSAHEYGPEDLLPEAQETEAVRPKRGPAPPRAGFVRAPQAPVAIPTPAPIETPLLTSPAVPPAVLEEPVVIPFATPTMTPAQSAPTIPALAAPIRTGASSPNRRALIILSSLFSLVFLALIYFVDRFRRVLRAEATPPASHHSPQSIPDSDSSRIRVDHQPAVVESINRAEKPAKNLKNKMRKARYN